MVVLPGEGRGGRLLATLMSESFDLRRFKSGDLIGVLEVDIGVAVLLLQGSTTLIGAGEEALGGSAGPEGTGGGVPARAGDGRGFGTVAGSGLPCCAWALARIS